MTRSRDELPAAPPARDLADLETFGQAVDVAHRCNAVAVERGRLDLTFPSRQALGEFARRDDAYVVRVRDDATVTGLGVFVADPDKGGAQLRWLVVPLGPAFAEIAKEIIDAGVERYGYAWGRVENPAVNAAIRAIGYRASADDPRVLEAGHR